MSLSGGSEPPVVINRFENASATVNIQVGSVGGDVTVVLDRPAYRLEAFSPIPRQRIPRSQRSPGHLLDAAREVVPFRDRPEQQHLAAWLADEEPVSVLLVTGPGGQGKTRLAGQFATGAFHAGWAVMRASEKPGPLRPAARTAEPTPGQGVLVVADYAERWSLPVLVRLVEDLVIDYAGRVVRVLLLARPERELWETMRAELGRSGANLPSPLTLGGFTATAGETAEAYRQAVQAFQEELGQPPHVLPPPDGVGAADPLSLYMRALAAVCADAEGRPPPDAGDLSAFLLDHERRYWNSRALPAGVAESLVLVATLFGPFASAREGRQWVRQARLADGEAEATRVLEAHYWLYPPSSGAPPAAGQPEGTGGEVLFPLKPDRLAEDFIAAQLTQAGRRELVTDLISVADQEVSRPAVLRCLDMIAGASRYPQVREVLFGWLRARSKLAGSAPPSVLYAVLEHGDRDLIETVDAALPRLNTELLRPARDIAQHLLDTLPASAPPTERAQRLTTLGVRLSDIGDPQAALALAQETVEVCRRPAETEPAAYLPHLAAALTNLGILLRSAGDIQAALAPARQAVEIYMRLAKAEPAHLSHLSAALTNLGILLRDVGDTQAALAVTQLALTIRRQVAEAEPAAHLADLASQLNNLGAIGDTQAALASARQAVEIYMRLAEAEPAAYLPGLAAAVNNLGSRLSLAGDTRAAVALIKTAVAISRRLAEAEPAAYLPGLANVLTSLGINLSGAGDTRAALAPTREAVAIRRRLAEAEPAAHLPDLATALCAHAWVREADGSEIAEAITSATEAVEIFEQLAGQLPAAIAGNLATARATLERLHRVPGRAPGAPGPGGVPSWPAAG
jgi:tetratricopeptide (TPR) repeat protein